MTINGIPYCSEEQSGASIQFCIAASNAINTYCGDFLGRQKQTLRLRIIYNAQKKRYEVVMPKRPIQELIPINIPASSIQINKPLDHIQAIWFTTTPTDNYLYCEVITGWDFTKLPGSPEVDLTLQVFNISELNQQKIQQQFNVNDLYVGQIFVTTGVNNEGNIYFYYLVPIDLSNQTDARKNQWYLRNTGEIKYQDFRFDDFMQQAVFPDDLVTAACTVARRMEAQQRNPVQHAETRTHNLMYDLKGILQQYVDSYA